MLSDQDLSMRVRVMGFRYGFEVCAEDGGFG